MFFNREYYMQSQTTNLRATNITAYGGSNQLNVQTALTNAVILQFTAAAGRTNIISNKSGSAGYQPLFFETNGSDQFQITTAGNLATAGGTAIISNAGALTGLTLNTATNCSSSGGTCGSAASGAVAITNPATTVTVSTTAVNANSNIIITQNTTIGTRLTVTCNTSLTDLSLIHI